MASRFIILHSRHSKNNFYIKTKFKKYYVRGKIKIRALCSAEYDSKLDTQCILRVLFSFKTESRKKVQNEK